MRVFRGEEVGLAAAREPLQDEKLLWAEKKLDKVPRRQQSRSTDGVCL